MRTRTPAVVDPTERRRLLAAGAAVVAGATLPAWAAAQAQPRLLVLVELRGGNDGLNTVVPVDDGRYRDLRPRLALDPDAIVRLAPGCALHPALAPLAPLWAAGEMAVLHGVGYPQPNLSHFRSIEIWDTGSDSRQVLDRGWLTRAAQTSTAFSGYGADGVVIGAADLGPLGGGARAIATSDPLRFAAQARLASGERVAARGALAHLVRVEADIARAAAAIRPVAGFATEFPRGPVGHAVRHAAGIAATGQVPVVRLALPGFDTHQFQLPVHAALLKQFAEGVAALRAALAEHGLWRDTLVLSYSEFGRRPRENRTGGTDHGTASALFAFGPRVRPGVHGEAPRLDRLDDDGNLVHSVDFRRVYAEILESLWQIPAERVLQRRFAPVGFLRA
jgi:uncharacterized protein (DUF1501 family)